MRIDVHKSGKRKKREKKCNQKGNTGNCNSSNFNYVQGLRRGIKCPKSHVRWSIPQAQAQAKGNKLRDRQQS